MPRALSSMAMLTPNEGIRLERNADSTTPLLKQASSQRCSVRPKIARLLGNWWLWEILGAAIALLAVLAIFIILMIYDSSSLPDWPSVFTVRRSSYIQTLHDLAKS